MPNHFTTKVKFSGPSAKLRLLAEWLKGEEEVFSVQTIIPMPKALSDTKTGFAGDLHEWIDTPDGPAPVPDADELRARYGAANWYDASKYLWGTKWGSYDSIMTEEPQAENNEEEYDTLIYRYQSAWGPADNAHGLIDSVCDAIGVTMKAKGHDEGEDSFDDKPINPGIVYRTYLPDETWERIERIFGAEVLKAVEED